MSGRNLLGRAGAGRGYATGEGGWRLASEEKAPTRNQGTTEAMDGGCGM